MILVADSGSTKTEWMVIDAGNSSASIISAGINPYFLSTEEIYELIRKYLGPLSKESIERMFFYGTGCNSEAKNSKVRQALNTLFPNCNIFIGSDLLGAARSLCQDEPGIACIMGTGSNSCYYDGSEIISNVSPLGYILGDEGGGAFLGKRLLTAVLKKQVPNRVIQAFFNTYKMTPAEILDSVYMKPFPNRFLGQFAKFISANIHFPELQKIVVSSFDDFINNNILQYPESKEFPINFTGSIAYYFRPFLENQLSKNNLKPGKITLSPVADLVKFHIRDSNKI